MSNLKLVEATPGEPVVSYDVTEADIQATRKKYAALTADSPEGYEEVRLAIAHVRTTRTAVEKRRVEMKATALAFGKRVDGVAKQLTEMLLEIEEPLKSKRDAVDNEKARLKAEKEAARVAEIEAKLRAEREAQEALDRAARAAEDERLRAEQVRINAERAELRRQQKEEAIRAAAAEAAEREARARLDLERLQLEEERRASERAEHQRNARIQAEADAAARVERERVAAEEARIAALERAERERKLLEAMRPDAEKLLAFAASIRALEAGLPTLNTGAAEDAVAVAVAELGRVARTLEAFARSVTQRQAA